MQVVGVRHCLQMTLKAARVWAHIGFEPGCQARGQLGLQPADWLTAGLELRLELRNFELGHILGLHPATATPTLPFSVARDSR